MQVLALCRTRHCQGDKGSTCSWQQMNMQMQTQRPMQRSLWQLTSFTSYLKLPTKVRQLSSAIVSGHPIVMLFALSPCVVWSRQGACQLSGHKG